MLLKRSTTYRRNHCLNEAAYTTTRKLHNYSAIGGGASIVSDYVPPIKELLLTIQDRSWHVPFIFRA